MKTAIHILCAGIFWIWNISFLLLVYFGLLLVVGGDLFLAIADGTIPWPFTISLLGIMAVPPVCTVLGWRLRKHPVLLMRLFYGLEAPLFALCLIRLFVLRETTLASSIVLAAAGIAILTFALELFFGYAAYQKPLAWFQMATHSLVLMVGVYLGGILLFYTVPVLCQLGFWFFQFRWVSPLWNDLIHSRPSDWFVILLSLGLFLFSATLFVAMPYVLVNMFSRSWGRIFQAFSRQYGRMPAISISGGVAIAALTLFITTQHQPQIKAFEQLDPLPVTVAEKQAVLAEADTIRAGLTNAYLHSYRYLSPWKDSNALKGWYQNLFNLTPESADWFQQWHNRFFSPLLYQGGRSDADKVERLYGAFFDQPIQKGEAKAIQHALESTVNREETKAGLLNIDQNIVYLARQEVTVEPHGDWANVTLYERYENSTDEDQEIFYSFSLPESAAITGLWLGEDGLAERYPFVVSPRGAAQKVYNAEVERGQVQPATDPALLEQVGPRQYRLRVFPIPRRTDNGPGRTHLWLTYQVMQRHNLWPLPQLTEKRSIYWNRKSQHLRRGQAITLDANTWFEAGLKAKPAKARAHGIPLLGSYRVSAEPIAAAPALRDQRLAVVVDTSYSMGDRANALDQAVNALKTLAAQNTLDWYLSDASGEPQVVREVQPKTLTFFGSLQVSDLLTQFETARNGASYDALILLTDVGAYELAAETLDLASPTAPVWIVHLEGLAPAYEDAVLQAIQDSRGGVVADVDELLPRLAKPAQGTIASVADGYRWRVENAAARASEDVAPAQIAARQLILQLSRESDMTQVENLDAVHAIAKRAAIVTPYSSMLVLVDDRQREALRQAELSADRFDRRVEDGNDQLTQPINPFNDTAASPEPGMVLGLGMMALALAWRKRRSPSALSSKK